ncbi:hypothetical protein CcrColossus_gp264 [Caulobacter phage CcrColossus]|uniref:Uncharacterized protein n=1 Tax=Caulobacter phage CcrColossus TaxID=1211640 RepID=K4JS12_9CAUD|nr:hypothetical protein CcrColossus_gp264 [Caulobacter phage CcrColossus]AFU88134.1 hypothetical protein CcrColossus_gp264 [Caulobacter phage CcrColossus]
MESKPYVPLADVLHRLKIAHLYGNETVQVSTADLGRAVEALETAYGQGSYEVGNCLRGYHHGTFTSADEAWEALSERFNRSYPSREGRQVEMRRSIHLGFTAGGNETERDRLLREKLAEVLKKEKAETSA